MKDTISLPRSLLTEDILADPKMRQFVFYLICRADDAGEVILSLKDIEHVLGYSRRNVRTLVERLKTTAKVTTKTTAKTTILNIRISNSKATKTTAKVATKTTAKIPDYICPPFVHPELRELWCDWIQHRTDIKKPYSSPRAEQIGYNKLIKDAGGDVYKAKDMIEQSIAFRYQGLFRTEKNGGKINNTDRKNNNAPGSNSKDSLGMEAIAREILRQSS